MSSSEVDISPRAKKGRAILALVALSEAGVVSRQQVAAMLWSDLDRAKGLARLRDVLHHMKRGFAETDSDILVLQGNEISFRKGEVSVVIGAETQAGNTSLVDARDLLSELEGMDPAFDRWIMYVRETRTKPQVDDGTLQGFPHLAPASRRSGPGPSIIIMDFTGPSPFFDKEFVRSFTDELGFTLSRMRWFGVIAQSNGDDHLPMAGGDEPGPIADYGLTGHFQRNSDVLRLSVRLTDLNAGGMIVWASSFSHECKAALDALGRFANLVAASLDAELLLIEAVRLRNHISPSNDDTYTLVLQTVPAIFRLEREAFLSAGHRLERAVAADRESSFAHSWFALWHLFLVGQAWAAQPHKSLTQAGQAARRAMLLDPKDARAVAIAGHVKAYLGKKLREALALHEQAIQLNGALPLAWHLSGVAQAYAGDHDVAYRQMSRCLELAPADPHGFFAEGAMCIVHLLRRDYEAAVTLGRRVTERHPHFRSVHVAFLAALGHTGLKAEAASIRQRLMAIDPNFSLRRFRLAAPFQRPEDLENFIAGLRLAGVV